MRQIRWHRARTLGGGVCGAILACALIAAPPALAEPTPDPSPTASVEPTTTPDPSPSSTPQPSSTRVAPTPSPSPTPSSAPSSTPSPKSTPPIPGATSLPEPESHPHSDFHPPLSGPVLQDQIDEANRVASSLNDSNAKLAVAMRKMNDLSAKSNVLLEELAAAEDAEKAAREESQSAAAALKAIEVRLADTEELLRAWVFNVYTGGGTDADITGMLAALDQEAGDVGDPLGDLNYLNNQRTQALLDVKELRRQQGLLSKAADDAEAAAIATHQALLTKRTTLDAALAEQEVSVGELRDLQVAEVEKAGPLAALLIGATSPEAREAAARLREALKATIGVADAIGTPCTDDSSEYPNGLFPASALCPLWGAPGESLSPQAAAAFNALSKAYAAQTGTPLCVTDSYRSLAEQISVKASRGAWAAQPGTSRHGLGRALDLCGGVASFGSPAHLWMRQNAPLYGWFHPSWAEANGPLPEPWHWEFAG